MYLLPIRFLFYRCRLVISNVCSCQLETTYYSRLIGHPLVRSIPNVAEQTLL